MTMQRQWELGAAALQAMMLSRGRASYPSCWWKGPGNALDGCLGVLMPVLPTSGAGVKVVSRTCPQQLVRVCFLMLLSCYVFSPTAAL